MLTGTQTPRMMRRCVTASSQWQREIKAKQGSRARSSLRARHRFLSSPHVPLNTAGTATTLHPLLKSSTAEVSRLCHSRGEILAAPSSFTTWGHCYHPDHTMVKGALCRVKRGQGSLPYKKGNIPTLGTERFLDCKLLADTCSHLIQLLSS